MENSFPCNGLRHLGDSGNGGMTLEFLSPFLWRAPPLEMRRERREFFPDHAGKGSVQSSYEAETGLLWMWAGLSCFISSGDGYVGELLESPRGVSPHVEWGQARALSSRAVAAVSCFPSRGSRDLWLSLGAFP